MENYRVQQIEPIKPSVPVNRRDYFQPNPRKAIYIQWRKEPVQEVEVRREADKNGGIDILA